MILRAICCVLCLLPYSVHSAEHVLQKQHIYIFICIFIFVLKPTNKKHVVFIQLIVSLNGLKNDIVSDFPQVVKVRSVLRHCNSFVQCSRQT